MSWIPTSPAATGIHSDSVLLPGQSRIRGNAQGPTERNVLDSSFIEREAILVHTPLRERQGYGLFLRNALSCFGQVLMDAVKGMLELVLDCWARFSDSLEADVISVY